MKTKWIVVSIGILLLIAGIGGAYYYHFAARRLVYGAYEIAAVGVIIAALGALMKTTTVGATSTAQFTCAKCNAKFGSEAALAQHTKDKHGM